MIVRKKSMGMAYSAMLLTLLPDGGCGQRKFVTHPSQHSVSPW